MEDRCDNRATDAWTLMGVLVRRCEIKTFYIPDVSDLPVAETNFIELALDMRA